MKEIIPSLQGLRFFPFKRAKPTILHPVLTSDYDDKPSSHIPYIDAPALWERHKNILPAIEQQLAYEMGISYILKTFPVSEGCSRTLLVDGVEQALNISTSPVEKGWLMSIVERIKNDTLDQRDQSAYLELEGAHDIFEQIELSQRILRRQVQRNGLYRHILYVGEVTNGIFNLSAPPAVHIIRKCY